MSIVSVDWSDINRLGPDAVMGRAINCAADAPLSQVAFLQHSGASDLRFSGDLAAGHAEILWQEIGEWRNIPLPGARPVLDGMLVNACTPEAFKRAAEIGAQGAGLIRGEFLFAMAATALGDECLNADGTVFDSLRALGEWQTLGRMLGDNRLRGLLAEQIRSVLDAAGAVFLSAAPVFVRCFDYGDAYGGAGSGRRGVGLLLDQLPEAVAFLSRIVAEVQTRHPARFVLGLPLVSTYAELTAALAIAAEAGVQFARATDDMTRPAFGWEIETPSACLCTGLWTDHLRRDHEVSPAVCGIGTNDLTQYTMARPRRHVVDLVDARPESHPAVLALLTRLARDCRSRGLRAVLSGAAAADPGYRSFAHQLGFLVSCPLPALLTVGAPAVPILTQAAAADQLRDDLGLAATTEIEGS